MNQFLAFSKSLLFPSYCFSCQEATNATLYLCARCQENVEFLESKGRCEICFEELTASKHVCQKCQEVRLFDKKVCLFDPFSPIVTLSMNRSVLEKIASLFILGLKHFHMPEPSEIWAEDATYKRLAKQMKSLLLKDKKANQIKTLLLIGKSAISNACLEGLNTAKYDRVYIMLLHE